MVIIDDYSRYVIVESVPSLTAKDIIPVLDKVLSQFGVPDVIKWDNGPPFNSSAFTDFARYKGFRHRKITPLWPLANAEAERFMRTVKKTIKAAISEGKSWKQEINTFLLHYRAKPHSSTGVPPATECLAGKSK
jgi:transposase InsO family protein